MATLLLTDTHNISLALIFGIYWIGMYSITRIQYREYWQALNYASLIRKYAAELERLNTLDGLTGLKNRVFFDKSLRKELKTASRSQTPLTLLLLDIDHFKQINDRYGHLVGDDCLRILSTLLRDQVKRETDIVARYGGDEFAIIFPDMDLQKAMNIAEKIRGSVESQESNSFSTQFTYTVSIGVATLIPDPDTKPEQLIEMADSALYRAKSKGRNCVSS